MGDPAYIGTQDISFSNLLMEYLLNGMHGHIVLSNQTENELQEIITSFS